MSLALLWKRGCEGHSARMNYLKQSPAIEDVKALRGPHGQTLLDAFIEHAAWNRVESDTNGQGFWGGYLRVISLLVQLRVPMKPLSGRIWHDPADWGGLLSPMCWDGVVGLAVGVEAHRFDPLQWGAMDFLSDLTVDDIEHRSFYVDLAICVLHWEVIHPDDRMLDKYRKLGGTTRVAADMIFDLLPHVLGKFYAYKDDAEQRLRTLSAMTEILTQWQKSENAWSKFLHRTLKARFPEACALHVEEFLLGPRKLHAPDDSFETTFGHSHADPTQHIEHSEPAAVIDPQEAEAVAQQSWAGFVEDRARVIGEHRRMIRERLFDTHTSSIASSWIESNVEMPPSDREWTGEVPPRASQFGDTVYLVKFTRAGRDLRAAVEGRELETVRSAARQQGCQWRLPSGASLLLYPNQYSTILSAVVLDLEPHHVLITEAFLPFLLNEIRKLPSRANVRPSRVSPVALVGDVDGEVESVAIVEKTFLNFEPPFLAGTASVTQSLADGRHGVNPRRMM